MLTARLFFNNKSQALRLPKAAEYGQDVQEVSIVSIGHTRIIAPVERTWDAWFAQTTDADAQLPQREQPGMHKRVALK